MSAQGVATVVIVAAAVVYLIWKVAFSGRKPPKGPDVPTRALLRKSSRTSGDSGSGG